MSQAATIAATIEASTIGAVALILGAVIALVASLATSRSMARSVLISSARPAIESLQRRFLDFRAEVYAERPVTKNGPRLEQILTDMWRDNILTASLEAAAITSQRARKAIEVAVEALGWADELGQQGLGIEATIRQDMWQMADDGFELTSAILRNSRLSHAPVKRLRKLRRNVRWLYADFDQLATLQKGEPARKSGLVRRIWRTASRWLTARVKMLSKPFRTASAYLFRI